MWLGNLLLERSDDIYRMKGILSVSGMPQRFVFQVFSTLSYSLCSSIQSHVLPFMLVQMIVSSSVMLKTSYKIILFLPRLMFLDASVSGQFFDLSEESMYNRVFCYPCV